MEDKIKKIEEAARLVEQLKHVQGLIKFVKEHKKVNKLGSTKWDSITGNRATDIDIDHSIQRVITEHIMDGLKSLEKHYQDGITDAMI